MSKNKFTELVSGAGWIGGFIHLLIGEMRSQGWTDKEIHTLLTETDPDKDVIKTMVANLGPMAYPKETDIFTLIILDVFVDYRRTFDQMKRAGGYDFISYTLNEKNFPIRPPNSRLAEIAGSPYRSIAPVKTEVVLVHLNKELSPKATLGHMDRLGLEGSPIEEVLAVGEQYPNLQRKFPIIGLGSMWQPGKNGYRFCPGLYGNATKRSLAVEGVDKNCYKYCRFLARRKRPLLPPLDVVDDQ